MKSLAEQLREFMDQIQEGPHNQRYDLTVTIPNWEEPASDEDDTWEEEVDVGVNYTISGKHRPATRWEPEEHPDLDQVSVFDLATGQEITTQISPETMKYIDEKVWEDYNEREEPDPDYDREDRLDQIDRYGRY